MGKAEANTADATQVPQGLTITKDINGEPPGPNQIEYKIIVTNESEEEFTNVVIQDVLAQPLSYVSGSSIFEYDDIAVDPLEPTWQPNRTLQWTLPQPLLAGFFAVVKFVVNVSTVGNDYPNYLQGDCAIGNTAVVNAERVSDGAQVTALSVPVMYAQECPASYYDPDLTLTKTVVGETPTAITYRIGYENVGDWTAFNVTISDVIPTGLTNTAITPQPDEFDGTTATWDITRFLAPGASGAFEYTLTFDMLGLGCRLLTNSASIAQRLGGVMQIDLEQYEELVLENNASDATTSQLFGTCTPLLGVTKDDGTTTALIGTQLTYTISWTVADDDAPTLMLTDTLPNGVSFLSASNGGVYDANTRTVTWAYSGQAPGATGTETVTVMIDPQTAGGTTLTNTATLSAFHNEQPVGNVAQATDTTVVAESAEPSAPQTPEPVVTIPPTQPTLTSPTLTLEKSTSKTTAAPNEELVYTIVVKNTGNGTAENLALADALPAGLSFSDVSGATRSWSLGPTFAAGATTTIMYSVKVGSDVTAGTYTNTATLTATNHSSVTDQASIQVEKPAVLGATTPELTLSKTASQTFANRGDEIRFTVMVMNNGDANATDVVLKDFLPQGFEFVDDGASMREWTIGTLGPRQSATFIYVARVTDFAGTGPHDNIAQVSSAELDPIEARATIDVADVQVLGAETLAETGVSPLDLLAFAGGSLLLLLAVYGYRKSATLAA